MKRTFKVVATNGHWTDEISMKVDVKMTGLTKDEIEMNINSIQNDIIDALRKHSFDYSEIKLKN